MLGWFRRKKEAEDGRARAYEMGRQAAQQFCDDLDKLFAVRFEPVFERYLGVLQKQLNQCLTPQDGPPLTVARIEYKIFCEKLSELPSQMTEEIAETLSEWMKLADEIQCRDYYEKLIDAKVHDFRNRLTEASFQRLIDMAHALKSADDEWRTNNPEISARFPAEE
jgi:hypothetical protein